MDRCEQNACKQPKKEVQANTNCKHANTTAKPACSNLVRDCCTLSPVSPGPSVAKCNPCDTVKQCVKSMCKKPSNKCGTSELTDYGKEYASNTGSQLFHQSSKLGANEKGELYAFYSPRLNVPTDNIECLCVKHNGLQDTCKHPCCSKKIGCLDNPFPTCPPGKKWKQEYHRNSKRTDNCFD